jgi:hypothetical protein
MKTDMMMDVNLGTFGTVAIRHKSKMGNLNHIMEIGNEIRESKGLKTKRLDTFLRTKHNWEMIIKVNHEESKSSSAYAEKVSGEFTKNYLKDELALLPTDTQGRVKYTKVAKSKVYERVFKIQNTGRFENRGIWANLFILLDLATWLDVDLKYEVYRVFIEEKLLIVRDLGGDEYLRLNVVASTDLLGLDISNSSQADPRVRVAISMEMREKLSILDTRGYNQREHDIKVQEARLKIEEMAIQLIKMKMVTTFDGLLSFIKNFHI